MNKTALSILILLGCSWNSWAVTTVKPIPKYRQVIKEQRLEIAKAVASGQLTINEAEALREKQRAILKMAQKLQSDGNLSKADKKKLAAVERNLEAKIKKESTDNQTGGPKNRAQLRQFNQRERIKDGESTGRISGDESSLLKKYLAQNQKVLSKALKDGALSAAERQRLEVAQDRVNEQIQDEIKDAQRVPTVALGNR